MRFPAGLTSERSLTCVPRSVIAALLLALVVQIAWHAYRPASEVRVTELPRPPDAEVLGAAALGEAATLSRVLMLWLQAFDYQPGISVPLQRLDYRRLVDWLGVIQDLDPRSHYPLLAAARFYSEVPDPQKQRRVLDFVHERFLERPAERWPWLAHAVYVAKHKLDDLELALKYARAIRSHTPVGVAPAWAMQMELFVLEDMGDLESARVLIGGLLDSGVIEDDNQLRFLLQRLGLEEEGEDRRP